MVASGNCRQLGAEQGPPIAEDFLRIGFYILHCAFRWASTPRGRKNHGDSQTYKPLRKAGSLDGMGVSVNDPLTQTPFETLTITARACAVDQLTKYISSCLFSDLRNIVRGVRRSCSRRVECTGESPMGFQAERDEIRVSRTAAFPGCQGIHRHISQL